MKLTLAAENSIMILYFLAKEKGRPCTRGNLVQGRITARQLSRRLSAPLNHLYKLIRVLSKAGYIRTSQGTAGGLTLLRPARSISLLEVIELVEGPIYLANCVFREKNCALIKDCVLKLKLSEAQRELVRVLRSYTVADLVEG